MGASDLQRFHGIIIEKKYYKQGGTKTQAKPTLAFQAKV